MLLVHPIEINAVSLGRIVDKNVRHGADEPAVLDDRTAAHALDYAARRIEQPLVGHPEDHTLVRLFALRHGAYDFYIVKIGFLSDRRVNLRFARRHVQPAADGVRFARRRPRHGAEYAVYGILIDAAQRPVADEAPDLARCAALAARVPQQFAVARSAAAYGHDGLARGYGVTQRPETIVPPHKTERADAVDRIFQPQPQPQSAGERLVHRRNGRFARFARAQHRKRDVRPTVAPFHRLRQIAHAVYTRAESRGDDVPLFQRGARGHLARAGGYGADILHDNAVDVQAESYRRTADKDFLPALVHIDGADRKQPEQPENEFPVAHVPLGCADLHAVKRGGGKPGRQPPHENHIPQHGAADGQNTNNKRADR